MKDENFLTPAFFVSARLPPLLFWSKKSVLGPLGLFRATVTSQQNRHSHIGPYKAGSRALPKTVRPKGGGNGDFIDFIDFIDFLDFMDFIDFIDFINFIYFLDFIDFIDFLDFIDFFYFPWYLVLGTMGPWTHGPMGPWVHGPMGPGRDPGPGARLRPGPGPGPCSLQ